MQIRKGKFVHTKQCEICDSYNTKRAAAFTDDLNRYVEKWACMSCGSVFGDNRPIRVMNEDGTVHHTIEWKPFRRV